MFACSAALLVPGLGTHHLPVTEPGPGAGAGRTGPGAGRIGPGAGRSGAGAGGIEPGVVVGPDA